MKIGGAYSLFVDENPNVTRTETEGSSSFF